MNEKTVLFIAEGMTKGIAVGRVIFSPILFPIMWIKSGFKYNVKMYFFDVKTLWNYTDTILGDSIFEMYKIGKPKEVKQDGRS